MTTYIVLTRYGLHYPILCAHNPTGYVNKNACHLKKILLPEYQNNDIENCLILSPICQNYPALVPSGRLVAAGSVIGVISLITLFFQTKFLNQFTAAT